jgi:hypothetical protein
MTSKTTINSNMLLENRSKTLNGSSLPCMNQVAQKLGFEMAASKTGGHNCKNLNQ